MPITLSDEAAQVAFGESLGRALAGRGQVHLIGDLGAGKTTLARGILRAYGHVGAVKSPTYTLVEPYETTAARIFHFDLYRLGDPEELEFIGARDMLGDDALCLIEWPSRGVGWLPTPDLEIHLRVHSAGRIAWGIAHSEQGRAVMEKLPTGLRDSMSGEEPVSHKEDEC
ncbi:tRNA (adenosine(37)-N6)-threonylcarbamoyltransferase complex ATPase subunit type 1 TsaE [Salinicola salarius]|jgi:tRNA threonylcarbamoyladenosine biosynthesis protein TsaE|uniref:tRNA (adenosine(37)-N6)-threonylcarbamoyltransferase complex ATPase subunit type 1 TsaE n=1 Tax=Salinicola salarius TaxID=430457 RepID=UPI000DA175DA|nr:tRNA (adenosine(37)-N6)-threonylcarbamoyltransferase complex ATPase subunit type 1 TsaE [Salinicola salarius]MDF3919722.1 tRNA (adenosine(37)-N6)-threonylcarbamoyltransferase complex ATPase subunit type 1 TsaE [Salinicola salarius]